MAEATCAAPLSDIQPLPAPRPSAAWCLLLSVPEIQVPTWSLGLNEPNAANVAELEVNVMFCVIIPPDITDIMHACAGRLKLSEKRFLAYPILCVFLVFAEENLDAFSQCKMKSTE